MRVKGRVSQIETDGEGITIRHMFRGEKRIPYQSITSVQFRGASFLMSGFIRFGVLGGNEARRPLLDSNDENLVIFGRRKQREFLKLRALVDEAVAKAQASSSAGSSTAWVADELTKLANLRDRGAITDSEFNAQKAALLGG